MPLVEIIFTLIILFITELLYFRLADKYDIIDKPNHRSSHTSVTIRGGGIIFPIALLLYSVYYGLSYYWFLSGLLLISLVSFIDDIRTVSSRLRFLIHIVAVALVFLELNLFQVPAHWIMLALIFFIGTINAINFMDGINGITGIYGLVTLATLYYINTVTRFTDPSLLLVSILSVIVFLCFNFRIKARCFAGDVGSVSLAFIIIFFILQLLIKTQQPGYILLLLIYGLDAGTTIFFRVLRKENIFEAHRSHFYQYLANERKVSHLVVSVMYGAAQILINLALIRLKINFFIIVIAIILSIIAFVIVRFLTEGRRRLLQNSVIAGKT